MASKISLLANQFHKNLGTKCSLPWHGRLSRYHDNHRWSFGVIDGHTHQSSMPASTYFIRDAHQYVQSRTPFNGKPLTRSQAVDQLVNEQDARKYCTASPSVSRSEPLSLDTRSHIDRAFGFDLDIHPSRDRHAAARVLAAEVSTSGDALVIHWDDDGPSDYPLVWMKDNCRCPSCFNLVARARTTRLSDLDLDAQVGAVTVSDDGATVTVEWDDGHVSAFPAFWLRCHSFSEPDFDPIVDLQPELWDASSFRSRPNFEFSDVLRDDETLCRMLRELKVFGLTFLENAPRTKGQIERLAKRIGYLRAINYGEIFHVESKSAPSSAAFTSGPFGLHTDTCYYIKPVDIQMLHCIRRADAGGENLLVDGFKAANDLRQSDPDSFDILTKATVEFYDLGYEDYVGDFYQTSRHRIIQLNSKGQVEKIVFGDHGRSAATRMGADDVIKLYRALKSFAKLLHDPTNMVHNRLEHGNIMLLDNQRVIHGRESFILRSGASRLLEGGFIDWDSVFSKLRVLNSTAR